MKTVRTDIAVEGMTCSACTSAVTSVLQGIPGVVDCNVNLVTELASIEHDISISDERLVEAIEDAGFGAKVEAPQVAELDSITLQIMVMTCAACSASIEQAVGQLPGVQSASVNLITEQAHIVYNQSEVGIRKILEAIEDAGFDAVLNVHTDNRAQVDALKRAKQTIQYRKDTLICAIFGIPLIAISKLRHWGVITDRIAPEIIPGIHLDDLIAPVLVLPIQFYVGRSIYRKAFKALRAGSPNMDVLVSLSTSFAFFYSALAMIYALWKHTDEHQMYMWDACAMILLFVMFGKYLENKARGETSRALSNLLSLVPEKTTLVDPDTNAEQVINTDLLQVGDVLLIKPGEKLPVDGVVIAGESSVSEALLTGESTPSVKKEGSRAFGGTINGSGVLRLRVTSRGAQTKLGQIVRLVKEAQGSKAPIQRYADIVAGRFVMGVLVLAAITFIFWMVLSRTLPRPPKVFRMFSSKTFVCFRMAITVVVVACPCALGLATPTAVMAGCGVGAEHGILFKGGVVFEKMSKVDVMLFDKTGTITEGSMKVINCTIGDSLILKLVRALESQSEHPVSAAIVKYVTQELASESYPETVTDFSAVLGRGIRGVVHAEKTAYEVLIGSAAFLRESGIDGQMDASSGSVCFVSVNGKLQGRFTLNDTIRPYAEEAMEFLKFKGIRVGLISGDGAVAVSNVAQQIGIPSENVWSDKSPADKVEVVRHFQDMGMIVCVIGDGINDSPALATADVGVSLEGGTQVAVESADIVLMGQNPLVGVPNAFILSKSTLNRIIFNLGASLIYNIFMIPCAMGAFIPWGIMMNPMAAGATMAASSVSVVCSSLLLYRWKPSFPCRPRLGFRERFLWWLPSRPRGAEYVALQAV